MKTIITNHFDYLLTRPWFKYLIESKTYFTLSGSHALAFWAAQKNLKFRDVEFSDVDLRCLNYQKVIDELYVWIDSEDCEKYRQDNDIYEFAIITEESLLYDESEELGQLINLKARLIEDRIGESPVADIFNYDLSIDNSFVWVQGEGYKFKVLSLEASLAHKKQMFAETGKEKHQLDLSVFR
jgi:hypothetical protein